MLRTLLSPLSSRFPLTPRPGATVAFTDDRDDAAAAEDFARDVLIEVMRNSVERLKVAEGLNSRTQVLVEIHGIMVQDGCTKDVFREMDGFLVLMSVLSTIQPAHSWSLATSGDPIVHEVLEAVRLVFAIISEAMDDHKSNAEFFERSVGFESLAQAVIPLVSDAKTVEQTLGFLAALAVHNFSLSGAFIQSQDLDYSDIDRKIQEAEPMLKQVRHAGALCVLHSSLHILPEKSLRLRYSVYKLLERLSIHSHRNHAVLSSLNLIGSLFGTYHASTDHSTGDEFGERVDGKVLLPKQERQIILKLLKRLLELGATTEEARTMLQRAVKSDGSLDIEVLEILRAGVRNRWPEHLSLERSAALVVPEEPSRGLPTGGFTFLIWIRIEKFPEDSQQTIFSFRMGETSLFSLLIYPGGSLGCQSTAARNIAPFKPLAPLQLMRWTHISLVHYPHRSSEPTIRLFIDGVLCDMMNLSYPKSDGSSRKGAYIIGDMSDSAQMSWCIASAHFISAPVGDDVPRFIQHLGPRYAGRFQSADLVKFMTYEASTSLSIFLSTVSQSKRTSSMGGLIKQGLGISASSVVFTLTPRTQGTSTLAEEESLVDFSSGWTTKILLEGDVFAVRSTCFDSSMWRLGGSAIPLHLVQLANSSHELSRTLSILAGGLRNNWQNSDDMERLRGYEILADTLRRKSDLINITSFEILFEFLGLSFRSPDQSTIINTAAYRAIALDLQLWADTKTEIQHAYFEHFAMLLQKSKHKKFNASQRLGKMNIVRKLLFALQTDWYQLESVPWMIDTLQLVAQTELSTDNVIKPLVQYLAANLHHDTQGASSPHSIVSRIDTNNTRLKAEQVLHMVVNVLQSPSAFTAFSAALPYPRICLLLLGDHPSPSAAAQVLKMLQIGLRASSSFSRKFELVSGWSTLKMVLPLAWSHSVQTATFDILMGPSETVGSATVVCPQILPAIFASLQAEVDVAAGGTSLDDRHAQESAGQAVEELLERLIELHASSPTFRMVFQSQSTTQAFIEAYRRFVMAVSHHNEFDQASVRILEKLSHLGLSISLDEVITAVQKQEIVNILQMAEALLSPNALDQPSIDPRLIVDKRPRNRRLASMRLSVQLGERAVQKSIQRIHDWRRSITATEKKRLRKAVLDLREQRRQVCAMTDWATLLTTERGLWPGPETERKWRLDETEGPYRVRKKLEPEIEKGISSKVDARSQARKIQDPSTNTNTPSTLQVDAAPWSESYEISSTYSDEHHNLDDEVLEDKHRRVRHELEPGDVITAAETVARISGIDSSPGLLIFGRTHLYMLDGLVQNEDGEVIDAEDAPERLFLVPGSIIALKVPQKVQRWSYEQVASYSDRTFLFRDVALEIYFKDSRSLLVVFLQKAKRQMISERLSTALGERYGDSLTPAGLIKSPMVSRLSAKMSARVSARALLGFRPDELLTAQRKWQAREISNFTYISILNQISGRTPSDATQYPVFPWIIGDYTSDTLNLESDDTFRDLTKPMGAQNAERRQAAEERHSSLKSIDEDPFHYGTHFSSSMTVCHFLIRMEPFTHMFKILQGGSWDLPDRLFSDMKRAYESASQDLRGDVRELIPEFYGCPEFLENSANLDFGVQQTGERIHDVKLPPWAKNDPLLFVTLNRKALESDYVSRNLPAWIDLIWGSKQRDVESLNVFHPLSYEGAIDLDTITDQRQRDATAGIIHNFGQTPRKIFSSPHPDRMMHGTSSLPIGTIYGIPEDYHLLSQSARPVRDLGQGRAVRGLSIDLIGERIMPCTAGTLTVPSHPHETIEWDPAHTPAGEMRVLSDKKVVQVVEAAFCSCVALADMDTVVTGSTDYTVRLWRLGRTHGVPKVTLTHIMRGHTAPVTCIAASRPWSLIISGSQDGSATLWDLNRGIYVRSIWHGQGHDSAVHLAAINESTGCIATCSRERLWLHTINARPIAMLDLTNGAMSPMYPPVTSLAFHEREYSHCDVLATGGPDGTITLRTWNTDSTPKGEKARWEFVTLKKLKAKSVDGSQARSSVPCVTALRFVGETLFHGEDTGKVFCWSLPD